jgi:hypothetical protein
MARFTPILIPCCPRCGEPPGIVVNPRQAFCDTESCDVFCWDMTSDPAEFEATAVTIDLSAIEEAGNG